MAKQKLSNQCVRRSFFPIFITWNTSTPLRTQKCLHADALHTPESLAELWSVMRLGRPGTACVVRYQTA